MNLNGRCGGFALLEDTEYIRYSEISVPVQFVGKSHSICNKMARIEISYIGRATWKRDSEKVWKG